VNLLLLHPEDRAKDQRFIVRGRRAAHVAEVLRAEAGKTVRAGLLEGPIGEARVIRVGEMEVELELVLEGEPPERPRVDLVLAIPRPKSLAKLLPEVSALGIDRLILLRTWRVQKPYLTVQLLEPEHYRPLLHEGMMQGRSTREPEVKIEPLFRPFIEDRARELFASSSVRLVAHPTAEISIGEVKIAPEARVAIAIGPEGGFIPYEIEAFAGAGFVPVRLGPRPLRVETACVAALAQIELLRTIR
jgi:RsmE family RNA methyltransferase